MQELSDENTNGKGEGDRRDDSNVLLDQLSGEDDSMETEEGIYIYIYLWHSMIC